MIRVLLVVLAAATALMPTGALAQRAPGGGHGAGHHFAPGSAGPRSHFHHRFGHQGPVVVFAPPIWYGPDPYYYPPAAYDPGPGYGTSPYGTASPPPPMPRVVQYPTGRYELRGDGFTTPYQWIWIPNPPSAPPPSAPPPWAPPPWAPPALQPAPAQPPASTKPEPPGNTTVYRWTDAEGVVHLTDRLDTVPPRYRTQARSTRAS